MAADRPAETAPAPDRSRILVVDDAADAREVIQTQLEDQGFRVAACSSVEEALALLAATPFDLIITDLRMPKMSGLEFCRAVKSDSGTEHIPILVVTSLAAEVDKPEDFWRQGLGCDEFLAKPFDPLALLGRVEYLLRRTRYVSHQNGGRSETPLPSAPNSSTMNPPPYPKSSDGEQPEAAPVELAEKSPEQVVRDFVESWNSRNFAAEYDALGSEMLGGLARKEYVERRLQLYADEHGDETQCHVIDIDSEIRSQMANVSCLREDNVKGVPKRKDERYTLRHTPHGWKIISVRSRPLTFTIES